MELQAGQNTAVSASALTLDIVVSGAPAGMDLDVSAFMLLESGKVPSDAGMIFYGQPRSADGGVSVDAAARRVQVELAKLPGNIARIAVTLTIDKGMTRGQRFGMLSGVALTVSGGGEAHRFAPDVRPMSETALILGELYQRNGQWKFRAVGQGFNGGLGPLAKHFGVDISDDPDAAGSSAPQVPPRAPAAAAPPSPPPPPPPSAPRPTVNLSKITLEKKKPVSLTKEGGKFGEIIVNLNWTKKGKSGWFGGNAAIDLDLGAMLEWRSGEKGVIQALGKRFGDLRDPPYVQLMGDDRTGDSASGEFLHINGDQWSVFKRVLIFAFIYEGAPNWAQANGYVTIKMPGQPELEARMDSHEANKGMCAIALLENDGGAIKATKIVEYFPGHSEMDQRFGFGFQWKAGSK